jgi:cytoskeletal protein CcmA (bactofilin family)
MNKGIAVSMAKLSTALCLLLVLIFGVVSPVHAAEFDENGMVPAGKIVNDDLFLTGQNAVMNGTVNGSLFVSGDTVSIGGTVNGDVFAAGRLIVVEKGAQINGNLFVGASQIKVDGSVGGSIFGGSALMTLESQGKVTRNLFYGGFSYEMAKGSVVKIDQFVAARQVVLNGTTEGDVNIGAAAVEINGTVGGDANIDVAQPGEQTPRFDFGPNLQIVSIPSGLRVSPEASIGGKFIYTSQVNQNTALQGSLAQPPIYQTPVPEEQARPSNQYNYAAPVVTTLAPLTASGFAFGWWFFRVIREFLTLFILGCLALWLLPRVNAGVTSVFRKQLWSSLGWGILVTMIGFIVMFLVPVFFIAVGIFVAAISLGGLAPAYFGLVGLGLTLIAAIFLFLVFTGSMVVGSYAIGEAMLSKTPINGGKRFLALFLGVLLIAISTAIPLLGGLWGILVAMTGMGAMWNALRQSRKASMAEIQ